MAEVETSTAAIAADIPKNQTPEQTTAELSASPAQEQSITSHPHDSEYDTASDLEAGDGEYGDEDEDGASISDDELNVAEGEEDEGEEEQQTKLHNDDAFDEVQKKVDEDRSNPQYIPKRGTFYEHDDRTVEGVEDAPTQNADTKEAAGGSSNSQSPNAISQASKTMKKWLPASSDDRWSHDRFDIEEQAPKTRAELVNAYGYDIRNEDAPPRARRRRRYGRGPSKYSRNWEDETAYLKASNTQQRKPPKPSDFPALNAPLHVGDQRPRSHNIKAEKENRIKNGTAKGTNMPSTDSPGGKGNKNFERSHIAASSAVPQNSMEFRNKQRESQSKSGAVTRNSQNYRLEKQQHYNDNRRNANRTQHFEGSNELMRSAGNTAIVQPVTNDQHYSSSSSHQQQMYAQTHSQTLQLSSLSLNARPSLANTMPASNLSTRLQQAQNRNDPSHGSVQMNALANQHSFAMSSSGPQHTPLNMIISQQQQQQHALQQQQQQSIVSAPAINHSDQGRPKRYSSIRRSQHDTQNLEQHQLQHQQQQLHMQQQVATAQPLLMQDPHLLQANLMKLYQENLQAQMQALQVSAGPQSGSQAPPNYAPLSAPPPPLQQQQQQPQQAIPPPPHSYGGGVTAVAPTGATYYVTAGDSYTSTAGGAPTQPSAQYAAAQPPPPTIAPNFIQNVALPTGVASPLSYASTPPPLPPPPPLTQAVGAVPVPVAAAVPLGYGSPNTVVTNSSSQIAANAPTPTVSQPGYQNYANYHQNFNTVGGTTYFVPPAQPAARPVTLPQRRPTNAIPILPPSENNKQRSQQQDSKEDGLSKNGNTERASFVGSVENIDHIIDNMFVQRPVFQPPIAQARKSISPTEGTSTAAVDGVLDTEESSMGELTPPILSACITPPGDVTTTAAETSVIEPTEKEAI